MHDADHPEPWAVPSFYAGKHVVFGEVIDGMDVVRAVEAKGSQSGRTKESIVIADCGQLS
jgi:cyclophilin family peptidyl-prolyl cis-trans isomerase